MTLSQDPTPLGMNSTGIHIRDASNDDNAPEIDSWAFPRAPRFAHTHTSSTGSFASTSSSSSASSSPSLPTTPSHISIPSPLSKQAKQSIIPFPTQPDPPLAPVAANLTQRTFVFSGDFWPPTSVRTPHRHSATIAPEVLLAHAFDPPAEGFNFEDRVSAPWYARVLYDSVVGGGGMSSTSAVTTPDEEGLGLDQLPRAMDQRYLRPRHSGSSWISLFGPPSESSHLHSQLPSPFTNSDLEDEGSDETARPGFVKGSYFPPQPHIQGQQPQRHMQECQTERKNNKKTSDAGMRSLVFRSRNSRLVQSSPQTPSSDINDYIFSSSKLVNQDAISSIPSSSSSASFNLTSNWVPSIGYSSTPSSEASSALTVRHALLSQTPRRPPFLRSRSDPLASPCTGTSPRRLVRSETRNRVVARARVYGHVRSLSHPDGVLTVSPSSSFACPQRHHQHLRHPHTHADTNVHAHSSQTQTAVQSHAWQTGARASSDATLDVNGDVESNLGLEPNMGPCYLEEDTNLERGAMGVSVCGCRAQAVMDPCSSSGPHTSGSGSGRSEYGTRAYRATQYRSCASSYCCSDIKDVAVAAAGIGNGMRVGTGTGTELELELEPQEKQLGSIELGRCARAHGEEAVVEEEEEEEREQVADVDDGDNLDLDERSRRRRSWSRTRSGDDVITTDLTSGDAYDSDSGCRVNMGAEIQFGFGTTTTNPGTGTRFACARVDVGEGEGEGEDVGDGVGVGDADEFQFQVEGGLGFEKDTGREEYGRGRERERGHIGEARVTADAIVDVDDNGDKEDTRKGTRKWQAPTTTMETVSMDQDQSRFGAERDTDKPTDVVRSHSAPDESSVILSIPSPGVKDSRALNISYAYANEDDNKSTRISIATTVADSNAEPNEQEEEDLVPWLDQGGPRTQMQVEEVVERDCSRSGSRPGSIVFGRCFSCTPGGDGEDMRLCTHVSFGDALCSLSSANSEIVRDDSEASSVLPDASSLRSSSVPVPTIPTTDLFEPPPPENNLLPFSLTPTTAASSLPSTPRTSTAVEEEPLLSPSLSVSLKKGEVYTYPPRGTFRSSKSKLLRSEQAVVWRRTRSASVLGSDATTRALDVAVDDMVLGISEMDLFGAGVYKRGVDWYSSWVDEEERVWSSSRDGRVKSTTNDLKR